VIDLLKLLGRRSRAAARPRLHESAVPERIYAIGDIHGCLSELVALEALIADDAAGVPGEKWVVTLGDAVDRGPATAGVLARLQSPMAEGWRRIVLAGNHENAMLAFLADPSSDDPWLDAGGAETLLSFGLPGEELFGTGLRRRRWRTLLDYFVPAAVTPFLRALPVLLETPGHVFVHAGLHPGRDVAGHSEEELTTLRPGRPEHAALGKVVVHGHTVEREPVADRWNVSVDTGAYATGVLTAAVISTTAPVRFLSTPGSPAPPIDKMRAKY
jgi:serine/threonine protein phosphatase 1